MKFVLIVAIGTIFIAYGFSYILESPYYLGHIIGWSGVFLSIGASYLQYRSAKPFELIISNSQWKQKNGKSFEVEIPRKVHNRSQIVTVVTYTRTDSGYAESPCSYHTRDNKTVVISANKPFEGKVVIP